ncbi:hypothetical protein [Candidatus Sulfurimonas baltica]|uniref:Uncharacterized protein n=1 Tax=Candidatus Sulfurimonas baltica TaxID=2740404 RepID=A0A7S7RN59_9BACT|nr:hypothetical protein [Candidatus Sulfurimonas baltica]QOY52199.1 hypothetical protein HUE88_00425 [Candidatus Sulfurimonas baltica]
MKIEKLFKNLSNNSELLFYLFEHRDKAVTYSEIEHICSVEKLEILVNFEIIELVQDKIFLDGRVINFLENYLDIDENIEVSLISEKINTLKHKLDILSEYKNRQNEIIPQIRRELKKIDFILLQNLLKLRIHIDRVYKNVFEFSLKIKELKYYKIKLDEFNSALVGFEKFLFLHQSIMHSFYNSELNSILELLQNNRVELNRSLIPLTQDVIEYINKAEKKNIFIEKISKIKELKDSLELKNSTNILELISKFDIQEKQIQIKSRLDDEILRSEQLKPLLERLSSSASVKTKTATNVKIFNKKVEKEFVNIYSLNLEFRASNQNLIEFLLSNNKLTNKPINEISEIYCKLILLYEDIYKIQNENFNYEDMSFKKVYYDKQIR